MNKTHQTRLERLDPSSPAGKTIYNQQLRQQARKAARQALKKAKKEN